MRLVCPNCGAQYEVDDRVIPEGGRDVQCSACGHGWYQMPPVHKSEDEPEDTLPTEQDELHADEPEQPDDAGDAGVHIPPEPDAYGDADQAEPDSQPTKAPPSPEPRKIDTGVRSILQEEAQRELEARAGEPKDSPTVETQPDLGLDAGLSEDEERRRIARERMARMRGLDEEDADVDLPQAEFDVNNTSPAHPARAPQGKDLFPDIEEINSTLDSHAPNTDSAVGEGAQAPVKKAASGFGRGFSLILLLATLMVTVYILAPKLATTIPALEPALTAYVEAVNTARIWLDSTLRGVVDKIEDATGGAGGGA